jgi:hypothetical protein
LYRIVNRLAYIYLTLVVFLGALISSSYAVNVKNLYSDEIAIADDSQDTKITATHNALAKILVKVTGTTSVLEHKHAKAALAEPEKYVAKSRSFKKTADNTTTKILHIDFAPVAINKLVKEMNYEIWSDSRPQIIYWLAIENNHKKQQPSAQELKFIAEKSAQRAVPYTFPIEDLSVSSNISLNQIWNKDLAAIKEASKSYMADVIVIAKFYQDDLGYWISDWSIVSNNKEYAWSLQDLYLQQIFNKGIDKLSNLLMEQYTSNTLNQLRVYTVEIDKVDSYSKLQYLLKNFQKNSLVQDVSIKSVQNDKVLLQISAKADFVKLKNSLQLANFLSDNSSDETRLIYKWRA